MNVIKFPQGSVPVSVAAKVFGKDPSWVRAGIISGWLPIGKATRNRQLITSIDDMDSKQGRINFIFLRNDYGKKQATYGMERGELNGNKDTSGIIEEK